MAQPAILQDRQDFSLVLGGPLFQLFRRFGMGGDAMQMALRRMLLLAGITWLPLLLLSAFAGRAQGGATGFPFLHDIEAHVRFLVALPILIAAELVVHQRIRPVVGRFVERGIVAPEEVPGFHRAIDSVMRVRNSVVAEVALLAVVYTLGLVWRSQVAVATESWHAVADSGQMRLTPAGYWYDFVSVPLVQFILLRWYLRLGLWFWFLWKVSRLNLRLVPTHPDRTAGLAFLGGSTYAFSPVLFAQGVLLAGLIASQIFYAGRGLLDFKVEIAALVGLFVLFMLGPLAMFTPILARAKREGLAAYGKLASRYTQEFDRKWVQGEAPAGEPLMGSADIQSLADLGNSYAVVQEMRLVPFGLKDVTQLVAVTAAPLLPLALTVFSLEEIVSRLIKIIF
jgi:hypothetical protein